MTLALSAQANPSNPVRVASKNFAENYLLAEIVAQLLEGEGIAVERAFGLGGTLICYQALLNAEIDLYVEYTGTLSQAILQRPELTGREELNSALTDMANVLKDERWEQLAPGTVSHVAAMGGVELNNETLRIDPEANNNTYDPPSARFVYDKLLAETRFYFLVVTRHAAMECQLPRGAFDGSAHPVAR